MGRLSDVQQAPDRVSERNLVVLLLDTSASMLGAPIDELNAALKEFLESELPKHPILSRSGELAIGSFSNGEVRWLKLADVDQEHSHPFYFVPMVRHPGVLTANGDTPMGKAIMEALGVIASRKRQLAVANMHHEHRPVLYLLSDGKPTDRKGVTKDAAEALQAAELGKRVLFFSLGTGGADILLLQSLSVSDMNCYDLRSGTLSEILKFVSRSSEVAFEAQANADDAIANTGVDDPRHPEAFYSAVRTKYEQEYWDRLRGDFGR